MLWFVGVILQPKYREFADKTGCLCLVESGVEFFKLVFGWLGFFVSNSITYQKLGVFLMTFEELSFIVAASFMTCENN